jgi:hypothetical protein
MKKIFKIAFAILAFLAGKQLSAQSITTNPSLPVASKMVIITFDSSKESRLGNFTGDLYAHTGVIIEGNTSWQHVIGTWCNNAIQPKLNNKGSGIYELVISPDINTFYAVPGSEKVKRIAFVFRSSDGSKQTNDLSVDVYEEGLVISISSPADEAIISKNTSFTITATSSQEATLKLKAGSTLISETTGKTITTQHSFSECGWKWIIAEAKTIEKTVLDSVRVFIKEPVIVQTKPACYLRGINYTGDNSVALVLWAPAKECVFVLGDFNNWEVDNNFHMKKDGDYFWLEINNLVKGQPYVFQYLIDGQIRIADPYTGQTSDPNDKYITSATYPGLIAYPAGKASGIASVLQTGQAPYSWECGNFTPPSKDKLVIYELLVRDFTEKHSFLAVIEKLEYLKKLGINVLELMPVSEFEGNVGWGYNPAFYFAPDKYYGPKNDLKKLVDACHKSGIAVVMDLVLNHSYGQSPFVKMYWDASNNRPAANNPWYNVQSNFSNPSAQWGYDFNHESTWTQQLVDSINSFWMKEFKIDGFRFDFTKGFSNTPYGASDWGSAYDASRIVNLKRMATEIWKRNDKALVIFEHLADNYEEKELAAFGILLWGNMSGAYGDAAKGNSADLNLGVFSNRDWTVPHLVSYMESHDEERLMVKCLLGGNSNGSYNIRSLPVALDRVELNALFFLPLPGPKMIWQFGELGYDYSINSCTNPSIVADSCRLTPKPILWSYAENVNRNDLYKTMGRLNYLKTNCEEFSPAANFTGSLSGDVKWYKFSSGSNHVVAVGNFATSSRSYSLEFPVTGIWNDYFSGTTYTVNTSSQNIALAPGEFKLFTTRKMGDPFSGTYVTPGIENGAGLLLYPNPAGKHLTISSVKPFQTIEILDLSGKTVFHQDYSGSGEAFISLGKVVSGIYVVQIRCGDSIVTRKLVIQ